MSCGTATGIAEEVSLDKLLSEMIGAVKAMMSDPRASGIQENRPLRVMLRRYARKYEAGTAPLQGDDDDENAQEQEQRKASEKARSRSSVAFVDKHDPFGLRTSSSSHQSPSSPRRDGGGGGRGGGGRHRAGRRGSRRRDSQSATTTSSDTESGVDEQLKEDERYRLVDPGLQRIALVGGDAGRYFEQLQLLRYAFLSPSHGRYSDESRRGEQPLRGVPRLLFLDFFAPLLTRTNERGPNDGIAAMLDVDNTGVVAWSSLVKVLVNRGKLSDAAREPYSIASPSGSHHKAMISCLCVPSIETAKGRSTSAWQFHHGAESSASSSGNNNHSNNPDHRAPPPRSAWTRLPNTLSNVFFTGGLDGIVREWRYNVVPTGGFYPGVEPATCSTIVHHRSCHAYYAGADGAVSLRNSPYSINDMAYLQSSKLLVAQSFGHVYCYQTKNTEDLVGRRVLHSVMRTENFHSRAIRTDSWQQPEEDASTKKSRKHLASFGASRRTEALGEGTGFRRVAISEREPKAPPEEASASFCVIPGENPVPAPILTLREARGDISAICGFLHLDKWSHSSLYDSFVCGTNEGEVLLYSLAKGTETRHELEPLWRWNMLQGGLVFSLDEIPTSDSLLVIGMDQKGANFLDVVDIEKQMTKLRFLGGAYCGTALRQAGGAVGEVIEGLLDCRLPSAWKGKKARREALQQHSVLDVDDFGTAYTRADYDADRGLMIASGFGKAAALFTDSLPEPIHILDDHADRVVGCSFNLARYRMLVMTADKTLHIYDSRMNRKIQSESDFALRSPVDGYSCAAFDKNVQLGIGCASTPVLFTPSIRGGGAGGTDAENNALAGSMSGGNNNSGGPRRHLKPSIAPGKAKQLIKEADIDYDSEQTKLMAAVGNSKARNIAVCMGNVAGSISVNPLSRLSDDGKNIAAESVSAALVTVAKEPHMLFSAQSISDRCSHIAVEPSGRRIAVCVNAHSVYLINTFTNIATFSVSLLRKEEEVSVVTLTEAVVNTSSSAFCSSSSSGGGRGGGGGNSNRSILCIGGTHGQLTVVLCDPPASLNVDGTPTTPEDDFDPQMQLAGSAPPQVQSRSIVANRRIVRPIVPTPAGAVEPTVLDITRGLRTSAIVSIIGGMTHAHSSSIIVSTAAGDVYLVNLPGHHGGGGAATTQATITRIICYDSLIASFPLQLRPNFAQMFREQQQQNSNYYSPSSFRSGKPPHRGLFAASSGGTLDDDSTAKTFSLIGQTISKSEGANSKNTANNNDKEKNSPLRRMQARANARFDDEEEEERRAKLLREEAERRMHRLTDTELAAKTPAVHSLWMQSTVLASRQVEGLIVLTPHSYIAVLFGDGTVSICFLSRQRVLPQVTFRATERGVFARSLLYYPSENMLCVGDASGTVTFFDLTQFWIACREQFEGRGGGGGNNGMSPSNFQSSSNVLFSARRGTAAAGRSPSPPLQQQKASSSSSSSLSPRTSSPVPPQSNATKDNKNSGGGGGDPLADTFGSMNSLSDDTLRQEQQQQQIQLENAFPVQMLGSVCISKDVSITSLELYLDSLCLIGLISSSAVVVIDLQRVAETAKMAFSRNNKSGSEMMSPTSSFSFVRASLVLGDVTLFSADEHAILRNTFGLSSSANPHGKTSDNDGMPNQQNLASSLNQQQQQQQQSETMTGPMMAMQSNTNKDPTVGMSLKSAARYKEQLRHEMTAADKLASVKVVKQASGDMDTVDDQDDLSLIPNQGVVRKSDFNTSMAQQLSGEGPSSSSASQQQQKQKQQQQQRKDDRRKSKVLEAVAKTSSQQMPSPTWDLEFSAVTEPAALVFGDLQQHPEASCSMFDQAASASATFAYSSPARGSSTSSPNNKAKGTAGQKQEHPFFTHRLTGGEPTFEDRKMFSPTRAGGGRRPGMSPSFRGSRSTSPVDSGRLSPQQQRQQHGGDAGGSQHSPAASLSQHPLPEMAHLSSPEIPISPSNNAADNDLHDDFGGGAGAGGSISPSHTRTGAQQLNRTTTAASTTTTTTHHQRDASGGHLSTTSYSIQAAASFKRGGAHQHDATTMMNTHWGMTAGSPGAQDGTVTFERAIRPDGTFVMEPKHHVAYPHSVNPTQKMLKVPLRNSKVPELNDLDYHYIEPDDEGAIPGTFEEKNVFEELVKDNTMKKLAQRAKKKDPPLAPSVDAIKRARKEILHAMISPSDDGSTEPAVSRLWAETPDESEQQQEQQQFDQQHQQQQHVGDDGRTVQTGSDQQQQQQQHPREKFPVTREQIINEFTSPSMDEETVKNRLRRLYVSNRGFTPDIGGKQRSADGVVTTSGEVAEEVAAKLLHVFGPTPHRPRSSPSKHDAATGNLVYDDRDGDIGDGKRGWPQPTVLGVSTSHHEQQQQRSREHGTGGDPHIPLDHPSQITSSQQQTLQRQHHHAQSARGAAGTTTSTGGPGAAASSSSLLMFGARPPSSSQQQRRGAITARMHRPSTATTHQHNTRSQSSFSAPTSASDLAHQQQQHRVYRPMRARATSDKELQQPPKIIYPEPVKPRHIGDDVRFHPGAPPSYVENQKQRPSSSPIRRSGDATAASMSSSSYPAAPQRPRSPVFVDSKYTPRVGTAEWRESTQKLNAAVEKATESQIRVARAFRRRQVIREAHGHGQKEDDALAGLVFRTLKRETVEQETAPELPPRREVAEEPVVRYKHRQRLNDQQPAGGGGARNSSSSSNNPFLRRA